MVVLLATAGYDQTIRFWDASSGVCYRTLNHADKQVRRDAAGGMGLCVGGV
jgi:G protein beta subunit-like protein